MGMCNLIRESAKQLMRLVKENVKPKNLITKEALDMAMGGSTIPCFMF
jgi:dihydroxy-acid dehydratase